MASPTGSDGNQRERDQFLAKLFKFHERNGTPIKRIPTLGGRELDVYHLYCKVVSLGGSETVSRNRQWGEVARSFNLPPSVTSASYAVRQHFIKLLEKFEADELGLPSSSPSLPPSIPHLPPSLFTRSQQQPLLTPQLTGPAHQPSTKDGREKVSHGRVLRSLQSGLPNEVDFAFNVLTILSLEPQALDQPHSILKEPQLLETMLAHVAVFSEEDPGLEMMYHDSWYKDSSLDYMEFWEETVPEWMFATLLSSTFKTAPYHNSLLFCSRSSISDETPEGARVTQVTNIIRNISFEESCAERLASHHGAMRFLLLAMNCRLPPIRGLALETLANLASSVVLSSQESLDISDLLLTSIHQCVLSEDKNCVVRGLEILGELAWCLGNEPPLASTPTLVYQQMFHVLLLPDCELVIASLEALYHLSFYGGEIGSSIVAVRRSIETLASLLTVRVEDFGQDALARVKLVPNPGNRTAQFATGSLPSGGGAKPIVLQVPSMTNPAAALLLQAASLGKNLLGGSKGLAGLTPQQLSTFLVPNVQQNVLSQSRSPNPVLSFPTATIPLLVRGLQKPSQGPALQPVRVPISPLAASSLSASSHGRSPVAIQVPQRGPGGVNAIGKGWSFVRGQGSTEQSQGVPRVGLASDEFARQWLRVWYEEAPGMYVSQVEIYTLYLIYCSQAGQHSILHSEDFYSQIRRVFPASLAARVTTGDHPMLMVAGLRRRKSLPSSSPLIGQSKPTKALIGTNLPNVALTSAKASQDPPRTSNVTLSHPPPHLPSTQLRSIATPLFASLTRPTGVPPSTPPASSSASSTVPQSHPPLTLLAGRPSAATQEVTVRESRTPSPSLLHSNGASSRDSAHSRDSLSLSPTPTLTSSTSCGSSVQRSEVKCNSSNGCIPRGSGTLVGVPSGDAPLDSVSKTKAIPSPITSTASRGQSPSLSETTSVSSPQRQLECSSPNPLRSTSREGSTSSVTHGKGLGTGRNHQALSISPIPASVPRRDVADDPMRSSVSRDTSPSLSSRSDPLSEKVSSHCGITAQRGFSPIQSLDHHKLRVLQATGHLGDQTISGYGRNPVRLQNGQVLPAPVNFVPNCAPLVATNPHVLETERELIPVAKRAKVVSQGNVSVQRDTELLLASSGRFQGTSGQEEESVRAVSGATPLDITSVNVSEWNTNGCGSRLLSNKSTFSSTSQVSSPPTATSRSGSHPTPAPGGSTPDSPQVVVSTSNRATTVCTATTATTSSLASEAPVLDCGRSRTEPVKQDGQTGMISGQSSCEDGLNSREHVMDSEPAAARFRPKCCWGDCESVCCSWNSLLNHAIYLHVAEISTFPSVCKWQGCSSRLKRMRPSLVRHLQTHHCSSGPPPPPLSVPTTLAKLKELTPFKHEDESSLTKAVRLSAALTLRNLAKSVPEARRRLRAQEHHLCEIALSGSEASTAVSQCLYHLHCSQ